MTDTPPGLNDVELDAHGQTSFWSDGDQYALAPHQPGTWMVFANFRGGKATPVATLHTVDGGWRWLHVNDVNGRRPKRDVFADWRDAVRDALEL